MKRTLSALLILCSTLSVSSQLTFQHNGLRAGDEIIKQQVEYKNPGRGGKHVIWDFGKLKSVNDEYTLSYTSPYLFNDSIYILGGDTLNLKREKVLKDQIIVGTEHNTMYYFKQKENQLLLLGYENSTTLLKYINPTEVMSYPINYGEGVKTNYQAKGVYSSIIPFSLKGESRIQIDAFGVLVLPTGDTLEHVIRTKTLHYIEQVKTDDNGQDSIEMKTLVETFKWYAKGYRYPLFETIRTINPDDSTNIQEHNKKEFGTAFFFPPQEHLYLDNDKDNLAVLDSLWNLEHNNPNVEDLVENTDNSVKLSYNFYPNPVESRLTLELYLEKSSDVSISLFSMDGKLIIKESLGFKDKGLHVKYLDCTNLSKGTYIILIETNDKQTSDKLIKK